MLYNKIKKHLKKPFVVELQKIKEVMFFSSIYRAEMTPSDRMKYIGSEFNNSMNDENKVILRYVSHA